MFQCPYGPDAATISPSLPPSSIVGVKAYMRKQHLRQPRNYESEYKYTKHQESGPYAALRYWLGPDATDLGAKG
jgi:hypothetical protein